MAFDTRQKSLVTGHLDSECDTGFRKESHGSLKQTRGRPEAAKTFCRNLVRLPPPSLREAGNHSRTTRGSFLPLL